MLIRRTRAVSRAGAGGGVPRLETLEARCLLSFSWTAEEVYLAELVNRARANPLAEGARLGLNLAAGLTAAEAARLVPSEPLALNEHLTIAARAHSLDMANRDFFEHVNPDGLNPTQRAQAAGYAGTAGENIAAGYTSIDQVHRAWLESVGHRKNVLSLHANFTSTFHYDEFGPGFAFTSIAPFYDYYTELFGVQSGTPDVFVLGVVFDDASGDGFYGIGEGLANVRIDAARATAPATVVATYTTDAAGNYQMALGPGSYLLTFTNLATGLIAQRTVAVSSVNVAVRVMASEITQSPGGPAPDDHANAGNLAGATVVIIDPTSGDGGSAGVLSPAPDTDLFRFTVAASGLLTITVSTPQGSLVAGLRVLGPSGNTLGIGAAAGDGTDASYEFSVVQGSTYYIQVESGDGVSTGAYVVAINGPGRPGDGGGSGGPGDGTTPPPAESLVAAPGAGIHGSGLPSGRITLTTTNAHGRPVAFQQATTGWIAEDLITHGGGPADATAPITWTDPKDGLTYAAARAASGLLVYRNAPDGGWSFRNLTAEVAGSEPIVGEMTVFITRQGLVCVAGLTASGDLAIYAQNGASGPEGYAWTWFNITQWDLLPQGLSTPAFTGPLVSYVTGWDAMTIAGLDAGGYIVAAWWAPGMARWSVANLTLNTGASPLAGGLTVYLTPWGGINLGGIDRDGKVSVAWWVPGFGGNWRKSNLTDDAGGPLLTPGSVASFVTSWGALNVVGVDPAGRLVAYWWTPDVVRVFGADRWQVTVLNQPNGATPVPAGRLAAVAVGDSITIAGITSAGSVCRSWWQVGGEWRVENLSDIATPV
jgi:hypothetical protein